MPANYVVMTGTVVRATVSVTLFLSILISSLSLTLLSSQYLHAATLEDANQDAIRIQQQQQQRLEELEERSRERKTSAPELPVVEPPRIEIEPDDHLCVVVDSIVIEGSSILTKQQVSALLSKYLKQCLSRTAINRLLQEITRKYFDNGYITTRAYLKPQDISKGSLIITVIEGQIESFETVQGQDQNLTDKEIPNTFPTKSGQILNLRALEQGLDQLNRLQSNSVRMQMEPGTNPGDSRIELMNNKTRSWHLSAGVDNGGQKSTGEYQGHLTFGLDNPTGRADYLDFNIAHDLTSGSNILSRSLAGLYEIPWQWWLIRFSTSTSEYRKELLTSLQTFETSGSSQNHQISADRVVHRNQASKTTAGLTLNLKNEKNYLEDVLLNSSSQQLTVLRGKLYRQQQLARGILGLGLTVHQGLPAFGAESDKNLPPDAPKAKFTKISGAISFTYDAPVTRFPLRYSMNANGQFCDTALYGSEQISIGGLFTVRGYFDEGFSGAKGGYIRNEISSAIITPALLRSKVIKILEPFVAFDWGSVKPAVSIDNSYNDLAGWGVGLRGRGQYGRIDLLYAQPINPPDQFIDRTGKLTFAVSVYM